MPPDGHAHHAREDKGNDGQPTLLIARAYLLSQLAAEVARSGHGVEGLALVDAAMCTIERNDGRVSESDFWKIKEQIHEDLGSVTEAEPALRRALEVARRQGPLCSNAAPRLPWPGAGRAPGGQRRREVSRPAAPRTSAGR